MSDLGKSLSLSGPHFPHLHNERVGWMHSGSFQLLPSVLREFESFQDFPRGEHVSDADPSVFMAHGHGSSPADDNGLRHSASWSLGESV